MRYNGFKKPNPRKVSVDAIASDQVGDDLRNSALLVWWGQVIAHDMTLAKEGKSNCTQPSSFSNDECYHIHSPGRGDPRLSADDFFPFARTESCFAGGARQQINSLPAYLDASYIYG